MFLVGGNTAWGHPGHGVTCRGIPLLPGQSQHRSRVGIPNLLQGGWEGKDGWEGCQGHTESKRHQRQSQGLRKGVCIFSSLELSMEYKGPADFREVEVK